MDVLLDVLKVLGVPTILFGVWKRWIRLRVTIHLGCVYQRPRTALEEAMDAGADPSTIFVEPIAASVTASATGPEHVPRGTPYRDALFIRVINRSERDITVMRVWVQTTSGDITVPVSGGQHVVRKDHLWETWVALDEVRQRIANPADFYTSVRVRVLQSRRGTWHSARADDSEVGVSGDVAVSARNV